MKKIKLYDDYGYDFNYLEKCDCAWVYSDPHFDDPDCNIMDPNWPTPEEQIKKINSKVGKNDALIILGDVGNPKYIKYLKGKFKILLLGNHDKGKSNYEKEILAKDFDMKAFDDDPDLLKEILQKQYPEAKIEIYENYDFHAPFTHFVAYITTGFFDKVYEGPVFINEKVLLSHEPIKLDFGLNIHGHDHAGVRATYWAQERKADINVCSNVIGFEPQRLDKLIGEFKTNTIHRNYIDRKTDEK